MASWVFIDEVGAMIAATMTTLVKLYNSLALSLTLGDCQSKLNSANSMMFFIYIMQRWIYVFCKRIPCTNRWVYYVYPRICPMTPLVKNEWTPYLLIVWFGSPQIDGGLFCKAFFVHGVLLANSVLIQTSVTISNVSNKNLKQGSSSG